MRKTVAGLVAVVALGVAAAAPAYVRNEITVGGQVGVGAATWEDNRDNDDDATLVNVSADTRYTFYFTPLDLSHQNRVLAPFLQRPSRVSVFGSYWNQEEEWDEDDNTWDDTSVWYGVAGRGYLPWGTGIGGTLRKGKYESETDDSDSSKYDDDHWQATLDLEQYFGNLHRLSLTISHLEQENSYDTERTENRLTLRWASAFGERFWLSPTIGFGKREAKYAWGDKNEWDILAVGLELGHFGGGGFAFYYGVTYEQYEADKKGVQDRSEWEVYLLPVAWFGEHFGMDWRVALRGFTAEWESETSTETEKYQEVEFSLRMGVNVRF